METGCTHGCAPTGSEYPRQGLREPGRPPVAPTGYNAGLQIRTFPAQIRAHTQVRPYIVGILNIYTHVKNLLPIQPRTVEPER
ncbi:hypothetical protein [Xanthocytophaga flava]|uniref:hypothetical protein n=1 Tax=Xanthocytophaga flava TaxID=3048013 RepID=UPI0028D06C4F|nr:hypothetical protein [Xanthocytophaga flavus]